MPTVSGPLCITARRKIRLDKSEGSETLDYAVWDLTLFEDLPLLLNSLYLRKASNPERLETLILGDLAIACSKVHLSQCKSVQEYLNLHERTRLDIQDVGGSYPDNQFLSKIVRGLLDQYDSFVDSFQLR